MHEVVISLGYNCAFLAAVIAIAEQAGRFRLSDLRKMPFLGRIPCIRCIG